MTILKLRKEKKDKADDTRTPAVQQQPVGQPVLGDAALAQIAQIVAAATAQGVQAAAPVTPTTPAVETAFNLGDRNVAKLNEVLGEEATDALMGALNGIANQSSGDAALLLEAIQSQQSGTKDTLAKIEEKINGITTVNPEREWATRGYNVFNDNQDETLEYLEKTSEAAGTLFGGDLVEKFEKAQEEQDYEFLDRVRAGVVDHIAASKKDHAGIQSSGGVSLSKSEQQLLKEEDEKYEADRKAALSNADPKARLAAVLDLGEQKSA